MSAITVPFALQWYKYACKAVRKVARRKRPENAQKHREIGLKTARATLKNIRPDLAKVKKVTYIRLEKEKDMRQETIYTCQNPDCRATDRDHGNNPPPPANLNCYKCHGKGTMVPTEINEKP